MIYIVASDGCLSYIGKEARARIDNNKYKIKPELILMHTNLHGMPKHTLKWLKLIKFKLHHHVRVERESDWQRVLRFITGNAVGVVFGGGGLRCWAHLGVIRALTELNIPIDAVGGSSVGAFVAGYYAMRHSTQSPFDDPLDLRELAKLVRQSISLKNITWPSASLFNGKDYTKKLQDIFEKVRIENLWLPFFCISTNLSTNQQVISKKGYLWKAIRSSTAVPLVFPPVVNKGQLYVDGGLLNNLPVDIMQKSLSNRGKVIAIELTRVNEDENYYNFPPALPFLAAMLAKFKLANKDYRFPHFIDSFLKSLLAGSSAKQRENAQLADMLIAPDLSRFTMLGVGKNDEDKLIEIGYEEALKQIKKSFMFTSKYNE